MVMAYVTLIIAGKKTFDQVPNKLKDAVRQTLYAMGLDENGHPLNN